MPELPSLREMIEIATPSTVALSPDGRWLAVREESAHWAENRYCMDVVILDATGELPARRLTRDARVSQVEWLDERTLAVLKSDGDSEPQVFVYDDLTGDPWQATEHEGGVGWFEPYLGGLLYTGDDPVRAKRTERTERFGGYRHVEREESASALYFVGLAERRDYLRDRRRLAEDEAKTLVAPVLDLGQLFEEKVSIRDVVASEARRELWITSQSRDDLVYLRDTSVHHLAFDAEAALAEYLRREGQQAERDAEAGIEAESEERRLARDTSYLGTLRRLPAPTEWLVSAVSPDGERLVVKARRSTEERVQPYDTYVADRSAVLDGQAPAELRGALRSLQGGIDQGFWDVRWNDQGLWTVYPEGCGVRVAVLDPDGGEARPLGLDLTTVGDADLGPEGRWAIVAETTDRLGEVYVVDGDAAPRRLTDYQAQLDGVDLGQVETIRWRATDGEEIEGVLRTPPGFEPGQKAPLLFVVHGGPTGLDPEVLLPGQGRRYYPFAHFLAKGFVILQPNYRGSVGRGADFLALNRDNLGVGDLADLEGAIDHLTRLGHIDPARVGSMGWSQGGYISAFAGLRSERFAAVSVGAGISDWYTYHVSNDIPQFTTEYLGTSPFRDRGPYEASSPIAGLSERAAPTLIQHGENDRRVPLSDAMELYRGLQEMGVPVELFVFPDSGHPITRPRDHHAVATQNLSWFCHWLLGEELRLEG